MAHVLDAEARKGDALVPPRQPQLELFAGKQPGRGGVASLRLNPQGKGILLQQLLEMPVSIPSGIVARRDSKSLLDCSHIQQNRMQQ